MDHFSKRGAYVTHNSRKSDITGGNLAEYMQLPLEPQKTLYCLELPFKLSESIYPHSTVILTFENKAYFIICGPTRSRFVTYHGTGPVV